MSDGGSDGESDGESGIDLGYCYTDIVKYMWTFDTFPHHTPPHLTDTQDVDTLPTLKGNISYEYPLGASPLHLTPPGIHPKVSFEVG